MTSPLRWALPWWSGLALALLCAQGLGAQGLGAQRDTAHQGSAQQPANWPRILWLHGPPAADPGIWAAVAGVGCNGVNVSTGADPEAPALAGLLRLLDQPAGKGLLELREAQFAPDRDCYEEHRSLRCLVRPACLADPELVRNHAQRAAERVAAALEHGPLVGVLLADEVSFTRHGNPLDYDFDPRSLARWRQAALDRFGGLAALQRVWEVDAATPEQLVPPTTDQVRNRYQGDPGLPVNLGAWNAFRAENDRQLAAAVAAMREAVTDALGDRRVPIGLGGLQTPAAFGGHHYAQMLPGLSLLETYDIGGARDLALCLADPGTEHWQTVFPADHQRASLTAQLAEGLAHGLAGVVVWSSGTVFAAGGEGLTPTAAGERLAAAFGELRPVAAVCAGARMRRDPVWVVESQNSVRAWWMLDSWRDGRTWNRRRTSYEAAHSTSQATRESWVRLLGDLGVQPRLVAARHLAEALRRRPPKLLVLGATVALSDDAVRAVESWCLRGGTVLADHSTAFYDGDLRLRAQPGLDRLFGLCRGALRWDGLHVREGSVSARLDMPSGLRAAELGLGGPLGEVLDPGDPVPDGGFAPGRLARDRAGQWIPPERLTVQFERAAGRGRAIYLNLAVCRYRELRLDPTAVAAAQDLRRRVRRVLDREGIRPPALVVGEGLPTLVELTQLQSRGGRQVLTIRLDHRADATLLPQLVARGPRPVTVELPGPRRVVDLRSGRLLGEGARFEAELDPVVGLFLELTPPAAAGGETPR